MTLISQQVYKEGIVKSADASGPIIAVVSTEAEDRMGDIINVDGWVTEAYMSNPVVMYSHMYDTPPIATTKRLWKEGKQLLAAIAFDEPHDPLATLLANKYRSKTMRAFSVGFRPLEASPRPGGKGVHYKKQELLEISVVAVPANAEALSKALLPYGQRQLLPAATAPQRPELRLKIVLERFIWHEERNGSIEAELGRECANQLIYHAKEALKALDAWLGPDWPEVGKRLAMLEAVPQAHRRRQSQDDLARAAQELRRLKERLVDDLRPGPLAYRLRDTRN